MGCSAANSQGADLHYANMKGMKELIRTWGLKQYKSGCVGVLGRHMHLCYSEFTLMPAYYFVWHIAGQHVCRLKMLMFAYLLHNFVLIVAC